MLSNLTIGLIINAYGSIAEMNELGEDGVRTSTDALDVAGNTTPTIGSTALVSLLLYGSYLTRIQTFK